MGSQAAGQLDRCQRSALSSFEAVTIGYRTTGEGDVDDNQTTIAWVGLGLALALLMTACAPADPPAKPSFATDVLPVMEAHCTRCHGGNGLLLDPGGTPSNPIL